MNGYHILKDVTVVDTQDHDPDYKYRVITAKQAMRFHPAYVLTFRKGDILYKVPPPKLLSILKGLKAITETTD